MSFYLTYWVSGGFGAQGAWDVHTIWGEDVDWGREFDKGCTIKSKAQTCGRLSCCVYVKVCQFVGRRGVQRAFRADLHFSWVYPTYAFSNSLDTTRPSLQLPTQSQPKLIEIPSVAKQLKSSDS